MLYLAADHDSVAVAALSGGEGQIIRGDGLQRILDHAVRGKHIAVADVCVAVDGGLAQNRQGGDVQQMLGIVSYYYLLLVR